MIASIDSAWLTVMHPDLRVEYQRGIYLYAKSLMSGLMDAEIRYRLLTDAIPTQYAHDDVLRLIKDIEHPHKSKIRSFQMFPRYCSMMWGRQVDTRLWDVPADVVMGDRSAFLQTTGGLINAEMVYEVSRLASSKPFMPALDIDFLAQAGSDMVLTTAPTAIQSRHGRIRVMQTVHDLFLYDVPRGNANGVKFRRRMQACVNHADMLLAMSEYTKRVLLQYHPEAEAKVRVLYQPVPADEASIAQSASDSTQRLVLQQFGLVPKNFILYVGAVEERKNVARLILAHQQSRVASKLPLVIAGMVEPGYLERNGLSPTSHEDGLTRIISVETGTADTVFVGRVTEVEKLVLLRNAALFAFPTLVEGFGIPVLEAQSFGCPVLASASSTMPEILGRTAYLVEKIDSVTALSHALDNVVGHPHMAHQLAEAGLRNSLRFTKKSFSTNLKTLIDECRATPRRCM